jgi:hypothetical protein
MSAVNVATLQQDMSQAAQVLLIDCCVWCVSCRSCATPQAYQMYAVYVCMPSIYMGETQRITVRIYRVTTQAMTCQT